MIQYSLSEFFSYYIIKYSISSKNLLPQRSSSLVIDLGGILSISSGEYVSLVFVPFETIFPLGRLCLGKTRKYSSSGFSTFPAFNEHILKLFEALCSFFMCVLTLMGNADRYDGHRLHEYLFNPWLFKCSNRVGTCFNCFLQ